MEALNKLANKVGLGKKDKSAPDQSEKGEGAFDATGVPTTRPLL